MINFIFVIYILFGYFVEIIKSYYQNETINLYQISSWNSISTTLVQGKLFGYYSWEESIALINDYKINFPEIVQQVCTIGFTINQTPILAIQLAKQYDSSRNNKNITDTYYSFERLMNEDSLSKKIDHIHIDNDQFNFNFSNDFKKKRSLEENSTFSNLTTNQYTNRPALLITGMHQGSDLLSMSMAFYALKSFLYNYAQDNDDFIYLLETRQIWIVPFINVDTYRLLSSTFLSDSMNMDSYIKNQKQFDCASGYPGVNLRRNYPTPNNQSFSRQNNCSTYYEGAEPFSEPETLALNKLLLFVNFTFAINFLAPSLDYLLPFNWISNNVTSSDYKNFEDYLIYMDLIKNSKFDSKSFGNNFMFGKEVIFGEVSDFMYHLKGIYAFSVELGLNIKSNNFVITKLNDRMNIMNSAFPFITELSYFTGPNFMWKSLYQTLEFCKPQHYPYFNCIDSSTMIYSGKVLLINSGLSNVDTPLKIAIRSTADLKIKFLSIQSHSQMLYCFSDAAFIPISFQSYSTINNMNIYEFSLPNFSRRSNITIGYMGSFNGNVSLGNSYISFQVELYQSYDGTDNFKLKLLAPSDNNIINSAAETINEFEMRKASYILIMIYSSLIVIVLIGLMIKWGLNKITYFKLNTSRDN